MSRVDPVAAFVLGLVAAAALVRARRRGCDFQEAATAWEVAKEAAGGWPRSPGAGVAWGFS